MIMEEGDTSDLFRQNLRTAGLNGLPVAEAMGQQDDPEALLVGKRLYLRELLDDLAEKIFQLVNEYAARFPLRLGIPKEETRRKCKFKAGVAEWNAICKALSLEGRWLVVGDRIVLNQSGPALSKEMADAVQTANSELAAFGLNWPGLDSWAEDSPVFKSAAGLKEFKPLEVSRYLVDHALAVAINNDYLVSCDAYADLLQRLRTHFAAEEEMLFSTFRELSGLTRKLGIPMLEHLDQAGVTVRQSDARRAGPTLQEN